LEPVDIKGFFGNFIISLGEEEDLTAGAVVLATGCADAPAEMLEEYGYGTLPGVISSAEASTMCLSGRLSLENGGTVSKIAIVHCASRERTGYCSVACCDATLNLARSITEIAEDVEISIFHSQICTALPSHKDWISTASRAGCTLAETGINGVTAGNEGLMLTADLTDSATGPFNIVIIHPPLVPPAGFAQLAAMLRVEAGTGGFPKPEHDRLSTVSTAIDGVYIAGGCAGPCRIADALLQADAVSGTILSVLVPGRMVQTEPCTSVITESLCKGCKTCLEVCTYGAISYIPEKRVCYVNQVLCRGCGGCAASCPSGAARARHFTSGQLRRQVVGVLE
jgi:heterodisulfide reductase subunit A